MVWDATIIEVGMNRQLEKRSSFLRLPFAICVTEHADILGNLGSSGDLVLHL